jgi:WXG100 family type VII secretion target
VVRADAEQIRAAADRAQAWGEEFEHDVEELMGQVRELMGAHWLGEAAASHADAWSTWEDGAKHVARALSGDAALLRQAGEEYDGTEAENKQQLDTVWQQFDVIQINW